MKNNLGTILVTVLITAIASVGGTYALTGNKLPVQEVNKEETQKVANVTTQATSQNSSQTSELKYSDSEREIFADADYLYQFINMNYADNALVRVAKADKEQKADVIISSLNKEYPEFKGYLLKYINSFNNKVIFQSYVPEADVPAKDFYSFDLTTKKFSKMKINEVYGGGMGTLVADSELYPSKYIFADLAFENNEPDKMYILDLKNDSYKLAVTLKSGETFDAGNGGLLTTIDAMFLGEYKVRYAVFDKKKVEKIEYEDRYQALIEYREAKI